MKRQFIIFILIIGLYSCNIDRYPYDSMLAEDVFKEKTSLEGATLGNYALLRGNENGSDFQLQLHKVGEYAGDNVSLSGTTTDPLFYTYNYRNLVTSSVLNNLWISAYRGIVGCNKIIELAKEGTSEEIDQLIGENYYLRAYAYFQLSNVFGKPYVQGTSNLSVPLKLSSKLDDEPKRNTVGEVYEQVIKDLLKAESLMKVNKNNSYATKEATQALLSRVYLYMGENQKAIDYADKVINSGKYSLLGNDKLSRYFVINPDDNPETIFCFKFLEDSDYNHGWYTVGSLYANIEGVGWGEMYASSDYLSVLNQNTNDVRKGFVKPQYLKDNNDNKIPIVYWINKDYKYIFKPIKEIGGKITFDNEGTEVEVLSEVVEGKTKYYFDDKGNKQYVVKDYDMDKRNGYPKFYIMKASLQDNVPQLWSPVVSRLAEMYLNKAEAYAKLNQEQLAVDNIDIIRERAGIPKYGSTTNIPSGMSVLDAVLQERRIELAFEGHRKFDVFRNNKTLNRKYPGTHLNGSNPYYEITPNDNRVIEYIPQNQINAQPNLTQNN